MKKHSRLIFYSNMSALLLSSLFCLSTKADVQASDSSVNLKILSAYVDAYRELKQNEKAEALIRKEINRDPKNAELWSYLGQSYFEQEQYQKSSDAFGNAALYADASQVGMLNYQRANAEAKAGQVENAKKYLKVAANDPAIESSAESAMMHIQSGVALPEVVPSYKGKWSGSASVSVGYDDNVLLFSESTLAVAERSDTASTVINPTAAVNYEKQLTQGLLNGSLVFNAQSYQNEKTKSYDNFTPQLMLQLTGSENGWAGLQHGVTNIWKTTYTDRDTYTQQSWDDTITWRGKKALAGKQSITFAGGIRYQNYFQAAGASSDDDRTGVALKPEVNWANQIGEVGLSAGMSYEKLFANGDNYKSDTFNVPVSLQKSFTDALNGSLGLTYSYVQYPSSNTDRKDGTVSANASLQRAFSKTISGAIEYGYTKNSSNLNSASYDRQNIGLKVTSEIK